MSVRGRLAVGTLAGCILVSAAFAADSKSPTQAYRDYLDAVRKASSLSDVLPYLSAEYRGMLESRPKKDHPEWLSRLKETANMKDLKIVNEAISGDKCTLSGTATSARGNALKGKVSLVKEKGAWKLDEEAWATSS